MCYRDRGILICKKFSDRDIPGISPDQNFSKIVGKFFLCGNDELDVGDIESDVENNFPRSGPGSGTWTRIPQNCSNNVKVFKKYFLCEDSSTFYFSVLYSTNSD